MSSTQQQLAQLQRVARPADDFLGAFPPKVMPTPVSLLEQGGNLLLVKHYRQGQEIMPKQRQIWRLMTSGYGEAETAPGNITVLCLWGLRGETARRMVAFSHMGELESMADDHAVTAFLLRWWTESRSRGW